MFTCIGCIYIYIYVLSTYQCRIPGALYTHHGALPGPSPAPPLRSPKAVGSNVVSLSEDGKSLLPRLPEQRRGGRDGASAALPFAMRPIDRPCHKQDEFPLKIGNCRVLSGSICFFWGGNVFLHVWDRDLKILVSYVHLLTRDVMSSRHSNNMCKTLCHSTFSWLVNVSICSLF